MYSGQDIVSQEECKITLASFYEGIKCFDKTYPLTYTERMARNELTKKVIVLKLNSPETASYDLNSLTLRTENFMVRPLIIALDIDFTRTFLAEIDKAVTGLEVIMLSDTFNQTRIMPLDYIQDCSSYLPQSNRPNKPPKDIEEDDSDKYPDAPIDLNDIYDLDFSYVKNFCTTNTETIITVIGDVSLINSSILTLTGPQQLSSVYDISPLSISLDIDMSTYTLSKSSIKIEKQRVVDGKLLKYLADVNELIFRFNMVATTITFSGQMNKILNLYTCSTQIPYGDVLSWCLSGLDEKTAIEIVDNSNVSVESNNITVGTTIFNLELTGESIVPTYTVKDNYLLFSKADTIRFIDSSYISDIVACKISVKPTGEVLSACNTKAGSIVQVSNKDLWSFEGDWALTASTRFTLLDVNNNTIRPNIDGLSKLADKIQFTKPNTITYLLFSCEEVETNDKIPPVDYPATCTGGLSYSASQWNINGIISGTHKILNNRIIHKEGFYVLIVNSSILTITNIEWTNELTYIDIPIDSCRAFCDSYDNEGVLLRHTELFPIASPVLDRLTYDYSICNFKLRCEDVWYDSTWLKCENIADNKIHLEELKDYSDSTLATPKGPKNWSSTYSPCDNITGLLQANHIPDFDGIYVGQLWLDYSGNLYVNDWKIIDVAKLFSIDIYDKSTDTYYFVNPRTYMLWHIGVPMEYIDDSGQLIDSYFYTANAKLAPGRGNKQMALIDFNDLPSDMQFGYNWSDACRYKVKLVTFTTRKERFSTIIDLEHINLLKDLKNNQPVSSTSSLITPTSHGDIFIDYTGTLELNFRSYAQQTSYVCSKGAEAFALATGRLQYGHKF